MKGKYKKKREHMSSTQRPINPVHPGNQQNEAKGEQAHANKKEAGAKIEPPIVAKITPSPLKSDQANQCRYETSPRWKKILEGLALTAGISYAIITFFEWRDLRRNFKVDERAWVGPKELIPQGEKKITVAITNTGKTPALGMVSGARPVRWCCDPDVMPKTLDQFDAVQETHKAILLPGATHYINVALFEMPPEAPIVDKSRMIQEVRGIVHYNDIFGEPHWTRFLGSASLR
jgi:hypothetical protein